MFPSFSSLYFFSVFAFFFVSFSTSTIIDRNQLYPKYPCSYLWPKLAFYALFICPTLSLRLYLWLSPSSFSSSGSFLFPVASSFLARALATTKRCQRCPKVPWKFNCRSGNRLSRKEERGRPSGATLSSTAIVKSVPRTILDNFDSGCLGGWCQIITRISYNIHQCSAFMFPIHLQV